MLDTLVVKKIFVWVTLVFLVIFPLVISYVAYFHYVQDLESFFEKAGTLLLLICAITSALAMGIINLWIFDVATLRKLMVGIKALSISGSILAVILSIPLIFVVISLINVKGSWGILALVLIAIIALVFVVIIFILSLLFLGIVSFIKTDIEGRENKYQIKPSYLLYLPSIIILTVVSLVAISIPKFEVKGSFHQNIFGWVYYRDVINPIFLDWRLQKNYQIPAKRILINGDKLFCIRDTGIEDELKTIVSKNQNPVFVEVRAEATAFEYDGKLYFDCQEISPVGEYEVMSDYFLKTKDKVFVEFTDYNDLEVFNVDNDTFMSILPDVKCEERNKEGNCTYLRSMKFSKDKNAVYEYTDIIPGADPQTLKVIEPEKVKCPKYGFNFELLSEEKDTDFDTNKCYLFEDTDQRFYIKY